MKNGKWLCVVIFTIVCSFVTSAQENAFQFRKIAREQGLSQSTVTALCQDHEGFLWIGTFDGLNRYDGYAFKVYKSDKETPGSLSADAITALFLDSRHRLWIGTGNGGLNRYDRGNDEFITFKYDPDDKESISSNCIDCIFEDSRGNLWIGTDNNLDKLGEKEDGFIHFFKPPAASPDRASVHNISALYEDPEHDLWIGTRDGLFRCPAGKDAFIEYRHDGKNPNSLCSDYISSLCGDPDGRLWIGTDSGLNLCDRANGTFTRFTNKIDDPKSLSADSVLSLLVDRTGTLWVGTKGGGLNEYLPSTRSFIRRKAGDERIQSLYEDFSGLIWIGTYTNGISVYNRANSRFTHYMAGAAGKTNGLSSGCIWSVYQDRSGDLWIGTDDGLNRIKRDTGRIVVYRHDPLNSGSLSNNTVKAVIEDAEGRIWAGTSDGLNRFDGDRNAFKVFSHRGSDPDSVANSNVYAVCDDGKGNLWIGTLWGLSRYNKATGRFTNYLNDPNDPKSLACNIVYCLFQGRGGELWIGTHDGLSVYNGAADTFTNFKLDPEYKSSLSGFPVFSLYEDSSHVLWIGTWGGGAVRYESATGKVSHLGEKDGLANDVVYSILGDGDNRLWFSTNDGISRFTPADGRFKNFNMSDGLSCNEFNFGAAHKNSDGGFFFGGIDGLNAFSPGALLDDPAAPYMAITDVRIFNPSSNSYESRRIEGLIESTKALELSHQENIFSIEFAAIHFSAPEKNQYAYMLEGFDKDWINLKNGRYVTYTNIDPGRYTFRVIGSNKDGVWNREGAKLALLIHPPLWRTWWAYGLYVVTGLLGVFLLIRLRARKQAERFEKRLKEMEIGSLKEANEQRTNFFINLTHELKTPLALIKNHLDDHINRNPMTPELGVIRRNLDKIIRDIVNILDLERMEHGKGLFDHGWSVDFSDLVSRKVALFAAPARSKGQKLAGEVAAGVAVKADPYSLERILNNLIDNAIKYTHEGGEIKVTLSADNGEAGLSVRDNGMGIPEDLLPKIFMPYYQIQHEKKNVQGIGAGLNIVKKIVDSLSGRIVVKSAPGKGSEFTVLLPLNSAGEDAAAPGAFPAEPIVDLPVAPAEKRAEAGPRSNDIEKGNVVFIEDNVELLRYLESSFLDSYNVFAYADGAEALREMARIPRPDVIVSDVMMDGLDGYALCRKVREQEACKGVPFIFLSAKTTETEKLEGLSLGAVDYIAKPFSMDELRSKIKALIELGRSGRESVKDDLKEHLNGFFGRGRKRDEAFALFNRRCGEYGLSERQIQIITVLMQGKEDKEIAVELGISPYTVSKHLQNIYGKLSVNNRVELLNKMLN